MDPLVVTDEQVALLVEGCVLLRGACHAPAAEAPAVRQRAQVALMRLLAPLGGPPTRTPDGHVFAPEQLALQEAVIARLRTDPAARAVAREVVIRLAPMKPPCSWWPWPARIWVVGDPEPDARTRGRKGYDLDPTE